MLVRAVLRDYWTGELVREATPYEQLLSLDRENQRGVVHADGRACYAEFVLVMREPVGVH
jgi:hypothetical protein